MRTWFWLAALLAALWTSPAAAQDGRWWRAESANFIVYGDWNERQVREAAQSLEDFDTALVRLTRAPDTARETKLEVYLVRGEQGLNQVRPGIGEVAAGFYMAGSEQIAAFVRYDNRMGIDRSVILFHEYAHHFMLHYFPRAYPRWYVEGFAEYVSTAELRGRRMHLGAPSEERMNWVVHGGSFPIEHLLAPERVERRRSSNFSAQFYAHAWFAATYVTNTPERLRGLQSYVNLLGEGGDPLDSFEPAFGVTPEAFERELRGFRRGQVMVQVVPLNAERAPVTVTRMPRAADDLLLPLARLRMGGQLNDDEAATYRRLAQRTPDDPMARILLARVAMLADDGATARAQLDAVLAADEENAEARYLLAYLILTGVSGGAGQDVYDAVQEARRHLVRGFRSNPTHYPTLYLYATTFAGGRRMNEQQLNVLARASELAPQSDSIRFLLARELIRAEEWDAAIIALRPLLYDPHGGSGPARARVLFAAAQARTQPNFQAERDAEAEAEEGDEP